MHSGVAKREGSLLKPYAFSDHGAQKLAKPRRPTKPSLCLIDTIKFFSIFVGFEPDIRQGVDATSKIQPLGIVGVRAMSLANWWYTFRTTRLSKPAEDRALYRATRKRPISSILEVGIGDGSRCQHLIQWLQRQPECSEKLRYVAIDLFEAGGSTSLKDFHSLITSVGAKPLPIPGDLATGLPRVAHTIGAVDLVILDSDIEQIADRGVLDFAPRIVHDNSIIIARDQHDGFLYDLKSDEFLSDLNSASAAA